LRIESTYAVLQRSVVCHLRRTCLNEKLGLAHVELAHCELLEHGLIRRLISGHTTFHLTHLALFRGLIFVIELWRRTAAGRGTFSPFLRR
jgi:hypothetical protein